MRRGFQEAEFLRRERVSEPLRKCLTMIVNHLPAGVEKEMEHKLGAIGIGLRGGLRLVDANREMIQLCVAYVPTVGKGRREVTAGEQKGSIRHSPAWLLCSFLAKSG